MICYDKTGKRIYCHEETITKQVQQILDSIIIPEPILTGLNQILRDSKKNEALLHEQAVTSLRKDLDITKKRIENLVDMYLDKKIDAGVDFSKIEGQNEIKNIMNNYYINSVVANTGDGTVNTGDIVILQFQDTKILEPNFRLCVPIAFENENLVVFDKPVGMPVHPSIKHQGDTLGNFFAAKYPDITFRPVNRLDRDTSGLCITAKNAFAAAALQNSVKKVYYAVVTGYIDGEGIIDVPIAREKDSIIKRTVRQDGQRAVTHYKAIKSGKKYSLIEIKLETGRTHQIRVHFAYIGHPLAGDDLYGGLSLIHI